MDSRLLVVVGFLVLAFGLCLVGLYVTLRR